MTLANSESFLGPFLNALHGLTDLFFARAQGRGTGIICVLEMRKLHGEVSCPKPLANKGWSQDSIPGAWPPGPDS